MTREETLDAAKQMVCGHREQDYGTPENNFQVIADLWNVYLQNCIYHAPSFVSGKEEIKVHISPFDVAIMMSLFKHGRIISGSATDDSLVDACGYLACGAEIEGAAKESLKEMVDLNREAVDKFKQLNENLQSIKSTAPEKEEKEAGEVTFGIDFSHGDDWCCDAVRADKKEEPKTEKPNKLKDLILKTYGDADGYIACRACPVKTIKEDYCDNLPCNGRERAVEHIYDYFLDREDSDPIMAIFRTMLEEDKDEEE